jgi:signal transduction histidine kinase
VTLRLTARSRLTLLYTGLVLAAGYLRRLHIDEAVSKLLTQAAPALLVVAALAGLTGWLVAGRILNPIRAISGTANRLSAENLSERLPVGQPADELATLAATINGMLDRIQQGIAERDQVLSSQRLFVANAAHELRTPLTTMRTAIDVTLDGEPDRAELVAMAGDIAAAVDTSQRTLDGLLILARSQAGLLRRTPVDLAEVAAVTVADAADRATDGTITLQADLRPAPASGEPVLLERMAGNLLDNALRYNHPGGTVTFTSGTANGHAFLRVVNTGRPVTPDEERRLFEPFVRGTANSTRGAGLGLSIVRAVVTAHDGEISSTARPTGGMDIAIHLPQPPMSGCWSAGGG